MIGLYRIQNMLVHSFFCLFAVKENVWHVWTWRRKGWGKVWPVHPTEGVGKADKTKPW